MKKILKKIRLFPLVNIPVRFIVRGFTRFGDKISRFFSLHWPVGGTIQFNLPEGEKVKIFSKGDDYISTQVYWKGYKGYEGASVHLFYHLSKKSSCIFDIGANIGFFSLIAGCSNRNAKIYSFEPVPMIVERLKKNASINNLSNLKAELIAAGSKEEMISFFVPQQEGIPFSASTAKGWSEKTNEIKVQSTRLDNYKEKQKTGKVDLVKMDCEFHEKEVIEGMENILANDKPILLTEILFPESEGVAGHFTNSDYLEIEATLKRHGYYFYLVNSTALIRVEHLEYNPDERNYLFSVKKSTKVYLPYSDIEFLLKEIS